MTDLVRVKRGRHPWVTEPESGGGGGGSQDLAGVLATGNDGGGLEITNIADPGADQSAVTVAYLFLWLTLANLLGNGNDGGGQQIKNIGDASDPEDAVTLQQLQAFAPDLLAVLTAGNSAGGRDIADIANADIDTLQVTGGDDSGPVAKITPPVGATQNVAEIGPQNLGLLVGPTGTVQALADPADSNSFVTLQRGSAAFYIASDGFHIADLPASDPGTPGMLYQEAGVVKVSL